MLFISFLILIVAIALPSLNKYFSPILLTRIVSIVFIYAGALSLNAFYIQSIGSGVGIYSGLFHVTAVSQLLDTFIFTIASIILISWPSVTHLISEHTSSFFPSHPEKIIEGLPEANKNLVEYVNNINEDTIVSNNDSQILIELSKRNSETICKEIENGNEISNPKVSELYDNIHNMVDIVNKLLGKKPSDNNFISNFNLDSLYTYLDTLSISQEAALLHIIIFITLLAILINILAALFGNEVIKYFDLESRFPFLSGFLKLRATYVKFYLGWNSFLLLAISFATICLNIFLFIYT